MMHFNIVLLSTPRFNKLHVYFTCLWSPCMHSVLPTTCHMPRPSHPLILSLQLHLIRKTNLAAPQHAIFPVSCHLLYYSILGQIIMSSSAPYSPNTPSLPSMWQIKPHTHTKQQAKWRFCTFSLSCFSVANATTKYAFWTEWQVAFP